ncbi:MAG: hypothetical protein Q4D60_10430 [Eubacteriales bacterium]|nr:hypothetical protein [Eubacteriales bacterium]
MFYRCKNCGGNVVYQPEKNGMICESCGSEESQQVVPQKEIHICANCGGKIETGEHTLACRCPYCQTFHVLEDRMEGEYKPGLVIPFALGKHQAAEKMRQSFAEKLFLPSNFCSVSSLESMEGIYVPFWMYDFHSHVHFEGEGDRIRTWREGDYECTETKIYRIVRDFEVDYDKIPVDASVAMEDGMMDLLEPYEYEKLGAFAPEYLSGFRAEVYEENAQQLSPRAEEKVDTFSRQYLTEQNGGFAVVRPYSEQFDNRQKEACFAFLPVWKYVYQYNGKEYIFYVNGQTGKVVGAPPISRGRMFGFSAGVFGLLFFFLKMLFYFLEVL